MTEQPTNYANDYLLELESKPPLMRTHRENEYLYYHFLHFPYFEHVIQSNNNLGDLMYRAIINCINFKSFQPGTPIYKINDPIVSMFILIEGEVNVYKKPKMYKKLKKPSTRKSINSFKLGIQNLLSATLEKQIDKTIKTGDTYGQSQFVFGKKHLCLVEAKTKCTIGEIARYDYMIIFQKTNFLERITAFNFLIQINAFKNIDNHRIIEVLYNKMKKVKYSKGDYIIKQGECFDRFCFVKRGRFKILKSYNTLMKTSVINTYLNDVDEIMEERFTTRRLFELKDEYVDKWKMELLIYEKGEIIGDVEYLYNQSKYLFSIQCDEDSSEIFELPINEFDKIANDEFKKVFNDNIKFKLKQIKMRIKNTKDNPMLKLHHQNKYNELFIHKINKIENKLTSNNNNSDDGNKKCNQITMQTNVKSKGRNKIDLYELVYENNKNKNNMKLRATSTTYNSKTMNKIECKPFVLVTQRPPPVIKSYTNEETIQTNCINERDFMSKRLKHKGVLVNNNNNNINENKRKFISILQYCPHLGEANKPKTASLMKLSSTNKNKNKVYKLQPITNNNTNNNTNTNRYIKEELTTLDKTKGNSRLLYESNKTNYSCCIEVNKQFFINNNTSILQKQNTLNDYFMNTSNTNVYSKTIPY